MGLLFTIDAGPRQCSHFQVRVPRDSWIYVTMSDSGLPQPGGPGPRIYIHQEQGGPVITPGTGFPFRRLLRLGGVRWMYSTQTLHAILIHCSNYLAYNISARTAYKTSFLCCCFQLLLCKHASLRSRYLVISVESFAYVAVVAQQRVYMPHNVTIPKEAELKDAAFSYVSCMGDLK
jgi:hypothetical protein